MYVAPLGLGLRCVSMSAPPYFRISLRASFDLFDQHLGWGSRRRRNLASVISCVCACSDRHPCCKDPVANSLGLRQGVPCLKLPFDVAVWLRRSPRNTPKVCISIRRSLTGLTDPSMKPTPCDYSWLNPILHFKPWNQNQHCKWTAEGKNSAQTEVRGFRLEGFRYRLRVWGLLGELASGSTVRGCRGFTGTKLPVLPKRRSTVLRAAQCCWYRSV